MTRQQQYELFLPFFEIEDKRYVALGQRATAFLGLSSVVTMFGGLNLAKLLPGLWIHLCAYGAAVLLLAAVLTALASLWIRSYKDICDVEDTVVTIEAQKYDEEDVYSVLLANLSDAISHNREINDQRATWLQWCATCFSLSVVAIVVTSIINV